MHLIKLYIPRTIALLVLFFLTTANSFAVEELVPSLSLSINGEKIVNGSCVNGPRDFSKAKFRIVDQNGNGLSYFQILQGNILPSLSDAAVRGKVLESGELDEAAVTLLKEADGVRITAFVKVLDKSNNKTIGLAFQFYINVIPDIVFGNITEGQDDVDLDMLTSMGSLGVEFSKDLRLMKFTIISGSVTVEGSKKSGIILENGILSDDAKKLLAKSAGKQVAIMVLYSDPTGVKKRTALVFTVAS